MKSAEPGTGTAPAEYEETLKTRPHCTDMTGRTAMNDYKTDIRKHLARLFAAALSLLLVILLTCGCGGRDDKKDSSLSAAGNIPGNAAVPIPPLPERVLFVGDSRTVDMFTDSEREIPGGTRDGFTVFALDACNHTFLEEVLDLYKNGDYDMLISWMGANDRGDSSGYEVLYGSVLDSGKMLILCTVGPTDESALKNSDKVNYTNELMLKFNTDLVSWAAARNVPVIDLWSFISDPANGITVDPADGVHYLPRPTAAVWQYILEMLGHETGK